jgi:hypothetical protein
MVGVKDDESQHFSNSALQTIFFISAFMYDLRPIELSMLFAVFRPLRTPVLNGQSSHI